MNTINTNQAEALKLFQSFKLQGINDKTIKDIVNSLEQYFQGKEILPNNVVDTGRDYDISIIVEDARELSNEIEKKEPKKVSVGRTNWEEIYSYNGGKMLRNSRIDHVHAVFTYTPKKDHLHQNKSNQRQIKHLLEDFIALKSIISNGNDFIKTIEDCLLNIGQNSATVEILGLCEIFFPEKIDTLTDEDLNRFAKIFLDNNNVFTDTGSPTEHGINNFIQSLIHIPFLLKKIEEASFTFKEDSPSMCNIFLKTILSSRIGQNTLFQPPVKKNVQEDIKSTVKAVVQEI